MLLMEVFVKRSGSSYSVVPLVGELDEMNPPRGPIKSATYISRYPSIPYLWEIHTERVHIQPVKETREAFAKS